MSDMSQGTAGGYETLRLNRQGAIDWLTLNRPERLNAMNMRMCEELQG